MESLRQIDTWEAPHAAAAALSAKRTEAHGDAGHVFRWASVTKLATALAVLVAAEEGTVDLDEPAGPPGSTVRHLLAHASGLPFEGERAISRPGERRVYSNTGFEVLADHLANRAEMPFSDYLAGAVLDPLGMGAELRGSAAAGLHGTLDDAVRLGRELLAPTLVASETLSEATTVAFSGLAGVLPDFGRFEPNDWGLGFELRDAKEPSVEKRAEEGSALRTPVWSAPPSGGNRLVPPRAPPPGQDATQAMPEFGHTFSAEGSLDRLSRGDDRGRDVARVEAE